jgi:hypothetical protein
MALPPPECLPAVAPPQPATRQPKNHCHLPSRYYVVLGGCARCFQGWHCCLRFVTFVRQTAPGVHRNIHSCAMAIDYCCTHGTRGGGEEEEEEEAEEESLGWSLLQDLQVYRRVQASLQSSGWGHLRRCLTSALCRWRSSDIIFTTHHALLASLGDPQCTVARQPVRQQ